MKFWDSSALVPLLVEQKHTARMRALYRADPTQMVWWGSLVECSSAAARLEREDRLSPPATTTALHRLDLMARRWQEIDPSDVIREAARRLLRSHSLRSADALQLAAAFSAAEQRPSTLSLICLDDRLALAAAREGFDVVS